MNDPILLTAVEPPLGWLIFNRPDKLNALNLATWEAIPRALSELEDDSRVRVILLRGADERAFAAGADISEFEENRKDPKSAAHYAETNERAFAALRECSKPTIGVIRGYCVGGGCAIALNLDIRIASSDARFAITPGRLGLGYAFSGIERAVQELGPASARYMFLTASHLSAARALQLGVIQEVHEPDELMDAAHRLGETIAANAPKTLRAVKKSVLESAKDAGERDIHEVERLIAECFDSEDYREGLRAFGEKRKPKFQDR